MHGEGEHVGWDAELNALINNLRGWLVGALESAEACLRFATVASESTAEYTFNSALRRTLDVRSDIDAALPLSGPSVVTPAALESIAHALTNTSDAPLAAWYAGDRIGRLISGDYGAHMLDKEGKTDFELADLDAYPIPLEACQALYGSQQFSERAGIDRHAYEPFFASGLALWRSERHAPFRVRIDTEAGAAFNAALEDGGGLRVGLIQPNTKFSDLHPGEYTDPMKPDSRFFGLRPADPAKQLQVITKAVDQAEARNVGIILLPELVTTEADAAALGATVHKRGPKLRVVVGGSYHHRDADQVQRNSTRVHFVNRIKSRRPADRLYSKSGPFYVDLTPKPKGGKSAVEATGSMPDLKWREDVEPSLEVRLYVGEAITVAVVICSDLLDATLRRLINELGPSLLLVCNMSYKTDGFLSIAHELVAEAQITSVMVNNPGNWPRTTPDHVIVGMPLEDDRVMREQFRYGEHVIVLDTRRGATGRPSLSR